MNIGYDAKRLFNNFTGLGNYSRDLVASMITLYPENNYSLYTPYSTNKNYESRTNNEQRCLFDNRCHTIIPSSFPYKYTPALWRSHGVINDLKQDKIDLYHGLSHELPMGIKQTGIKTVVTIHDLIFYLYPTLFPYIDRKIYYQKFSHACRVADRIIAISECTKRDIIKVFGTDPKKIDVIYQGCNPQFSLSTSKVGLPTALSSKYLSALLKKTVPSKYILSVGSIEERKNLLLTVKAMKYIDSDVSLVVVGRCTHYLDKVQQYISDNDLNQRIHFLSNVPFSSLPELYQNAQAFIYPSRYEGFGIPIIEALTSGTPVVAATGSCLEEAGGEGSIYVNPDDYIALAQAINLILSSPEKRKQMIIEGFEHIKQFQPEFIAQNVMTTYKKALL